MEKDFCKTMSNSKSITPEYVYITRIINGRKTFKRFSVEEAIEAYSAELVARLLENQKHRPPASLVAATKRDAEQDLQDRDEVLSGAVDQNIRPQSGPRGFGDLVKEKDAKHEPDNQKNDDVSSSVPDFIGYYDKLFPKLERQEQYELAKRWREHGDYAARDKLIISHLPLVFKTAKSIAAMTCR